MHVLWSTTLASSFFGIEVPSSSPVFLAVLAIHVPFGFGCVVTGLGAALADKRHGRHPRFGSAYYWLLAVVFATATALAAMRFAEDYYLFLLGTTSFGAATLARRAMRRRSGRWVLTHILGMSGSYVALLAAFYLDNAKNLPLWRDIPTVAFWFLPAGVAVPFVARALVRYRDLANSAIRH